MSNVNKLAALEVTMTMVAGRVSPGAKVAFDAFYLQYGFPGIQAAYDAGYNNPGDLWDFYIQCGKSVSMMAEALNLN